VAQPATAKPDAKPGAKPDTAKPDTAKPNTAKPDTAKPDTAKPDTAKPVAKTEAKPAAKKTPKTAAKPAAEPAEPTEEAGEEGGEGRKEKRDKKKKKKKKEKQSERRDKIAARRREQLQRNEEYAWDKEKNAPEGVNPAIWKAPRTRRPWRLVEQAPLALDGEFPVAGGLSVQYANGQLLDWVTMEPLPGMHLRGLSDVTGKYSYANAVIQALLGIPALVQVIVSSPISSSRPILRSLTLLFDYFRNPACPDPEAEPVNAVHVLKRVLEEFEDWGGDPDPAELLQWLLMRLHEETRWERKVSLLKNWDESVIRRIVSGVLWLGNGFDGFDVLGAEVPENDTTVEAVLKELVHSDEAGEVFGLQHAPPVLTLYLKRTEEDENMDVNVYLSKSVSIPTTKREVLENIHYDLRVAIVEDGLKKSTFVKYDFMWYLFRDERISQVSWNDIVQHTQDVSILIFARRSSDLGRVELRLPCSPWEFWTSPPPPPDEVEENPGEGAEVPAFA
jgi:hypothetical protein